MKKQTAIAEKQYEGLEKIDQLDKEDDEITNKIPTLKSKSDLIYNTISNFYEYQDIDKFNGISFESKYYVSKY